MAEAADTAPAQRRRPAGSVTTATAGDASAMMQQALALLFPSNLAAKAALFALVVALLPLLPTGQEAPAARIWELPYLLLLGIVISYGVFGQKNADATEAAADADADADAKPVVDEEAAVEAYVSQIMQGSLPLVFEGDSDRDGGGASKGGVQTWSSRYLPDDPLVVVADTAGADGDTGEKPLLLPVRKLMKPTDKEPATATLTGGGDVHMSDIIDDEEEEEEEELFLVPSKAGTGYDAVRERAFPSPPSVLDADLTLSPPSPPLLPPPPPPPPPPFLDRGRVLGKAKARSFNEFGSRLGLHGAVDKRFRSKSEVQATRRRAFAVYEPVVPIDDEADDEKLEEMAAASDSSSFSSDAVATADVDDDDDAVMEEINSCEEGERGEDDGSSCDEELFELAARPGALAETEEEEEVEDEVDRKADEFIAKFREQIRMQRGEPATRR
ncbi:hypothetical protein U9M48_033378 [Paspalum notatum var. saurae]|uniref:Uncharacterized protein n=1 Tax=Paspalum notatum var. saurae TaxID=547442 RepID=A0AAQ3U7B3_PASNO